MSQLLLTMTDVTLRVLGPLAGTILVQRVEVYDCELPSELEYRMFNLVGPIAQVRSLFDNPSVHCRLETPEVWFDFQMRQLRYTRRIEGVTMTVINYLSGLVTEQAAIYHNRTPVAPEPLRVTRDIIRKPANP